MTNKQTTTSHLEKSFTGEGENNCLQTDKDPKSAIQLSRPIVQLDRHILTYDITCNSQINYTAINSFNIVIKHIELREENV